MIVGPRFLVLLNHSVATLRFIKVKPRYTHRENSLKWLGGRGWASQQPYQRHPFEISMNCGCAKVWLPWRDNEAYVSSVILSSSALTKRSRAKRQLFVRAVFK